MPDLHITSPTNPRVKSLLGLRRRRARDQAGVTVVDGFEELQLALDAGATPETVYYCTDLMLDPTRQSQLLDTARERGAQSVSLTRAVFERAAYREGPDGFLAVVPAVGCAITDLALPAEPFVVLCEGLEKPGNLGSILRTAEAAGVDAVIAADPVTDWGNPNVIRGSKGTVFSVPVASGTTSEVIRWCRERAIRLVATTPDTTTRHTDISYAGAVAIAVGTEKFGLTDAMLASADERVRIPMAGRVNSLNASAAAAIVTFEAVRQRGAKAGVM